MQKWELGQENEKFIRSKLLHFYNVWMRVEKGIYECQEKKVVMCINVQNLTHMGP